MNDIIVYHGWYCWKRGNSCVFSVQYYRQHLFLSLGEGRKAHLPKMWEPSCRKNSSKTEQRTVMVLQCIRCELTPLLKQWLFCFCILHQSLKLIANIFANKNRPGRVFRMWARRQQSRNTAKFNLFNTFILFKNFLTPELYLQCRETARYQETSPQPR